MSGSPDAQALAINRLLKMAVVGGVEAAVRLHIDRGDNLNSRDVRGFTPLMLAAARNKAEVCRLLIDAGADLNALDLAGRDALAIAKAAGALDSTSVVEAAFARVVKDTAPERPVAVSSAVTTVPEIHSVVDEDAPAIDLSGWVADECRPPPIDDASVATAQAVVQEVITRHTPIDDSVDWAHSEAFLPEHAEPLARAQDAESTAELRRLLLRALREGSIPENDVEELCVGADGATDPMVRADGSRLIARFGRSPLSIVSASSLGGMGHRSCACCRSRNCALRWVFPTTTGLSAGRDGTR